MRRFNVTLTADAYVSASVQVAALNEADAEIKAAEYARSGGVSWQYNGVQDGTEETQDVSEECLRCNHRYTATDIEGGRCTGCGTMICAVTVEPQQAQSRFVLRELVVLRDDPNGEIFEVVSINGDSIGVRGQSTGPHPERALRYEDTLLQSARTAEAVTFARECVARAHAGVAQLEGHTVSPLRKKLNRALWLIIGLENGVALSHCAIDDPAQRRELLAAKDAITEALDLEGAARSTEVSDLKIVDDGAVSDIDRMAMSFYLFECGGCDQLHPFGWEGDCRDDAHRYSDIADYAERHGVPTWTVIIVDEVTGE